MKTKIVVGLLGAALVVAVPILAFGGGSEGSIGYADETSGGSLDTPSSNWQEIETIVVNGATSGPKIIIFSGDAFAQDYGQGGVFKGEKYAAMKLKLEVNDVVLGKVITFADNRGVIGSEKAKPMFNTATWGTNTSGTYDVEVYFKSMNQNDLVGFKTWNFQVIYDTI